MYTGLGLRNDGRYALTGFC